MDHNNLVEFFESFDDKLIKLFPEPFTFAQLAKEIDKGNVPLNNFKNYLEDEKITFEWVPEFIEILNVIRSIIRNPKLTLETYKDVKNAAKVSKMSSDDLDDTSKRADFWKKDESGIFRPEKMYTDSYEEGLIIYENRFVVFLIDKMELFLDRVLNFLYSKVRYINERYINNEVSMSELKTLDSLCDFKNFAFSPSEIKQRKEANKTPLLTLSDAPFLKTIVEVTNLRGKIRYIHSTNFYKTVKKAKPLKSGEVHMSNIMADSPTYSKTFRFYKKLRDIEKELFNESDHVLTHAYKDYVLINIMFTLRELGYEFPKNDKLAITQRHIIIKDPYVLSHPSGVNCSITASHRKINLEFEVTYAEGKFHKQLNLENKRRSLINFDVSANISDLYAYDDIEEYYKQMVLAKVDKGFTNSFVVTPYCSSSDDNIIFLSPIHDKAGSHLKSALIGCTIFVEGDPNVYHTICPICGKRVQEEDDDGNVRCPHCTSVYSFLRNGDHFNYKDTIWIKRLNKGPIKENEEI